MNSIIKEYYPVFEMYQALRPQLLELVTDADLAYRVEGDNPPLGELCREIGEVEYAYIQSFKTFTQDFSYRNETPGLAQSVQKLSAWYQELDRELRAVIEGLSEEDIQNRKIKRGENFSLPPQIQLNVYQEALLIFYGKATVYLKALRKTLPEQWREWIA